MTTTMIRPWMAAPEVETAATTQLLYREILVTPDLAQRWLGLNSNNRRVKPDRVAAYAKEMAAGRWLVNAEFIKFSGPEHAPTKLQDGQNRCLAIIKASVPVRMCVAFGLPDEAQASMDSGAKRSVGDNLAMAGASNTVILASMAVLSLRAANGFGSHTMFSNTEQQSLIADHAVTMARSADVAARYARKADARPAIVAYTHWVLSRIDLDQATAFWRDAAEKVGLSVGDPVIALTNRFAEGRRASERISDQAAISLVFRAWNYRRAGKPLHIAKVNSNSTRGGIVDIPEPK